ncbi:MAG: hypothetical protein HYX55_00580 [Chloroflexi bacterium]|nr:hypothetical protein [Chloroflexota bacterium]
MPFTNEAIVFVSHFEVKPGHLPAFRAMWDSIVVTLEHAKPRTATYLGYLTEGGADLTIVHVFPDARAMTSHVFGSDDRSRAAYEHIQPAGWEVYGPAPEEVLKELGDAALAAGVDLVIQPRVLGGFLRTTVS